MTRKEKNVILNRINDLELNIGFWITTKLIIENKKLNNLWIDNKQKEMSEKVYNDTLQKIEEMFNELHRLDKKLKED